MILNRKAQHQNLYHMMWTGTKHKICWTSQTVAHFPWYANELCIIKRAISNTEYSYIFSCSIDLNEYFMNPAEYDKRVYIRIQKISLAFILRRSIARPGSLNKTTKQTKSFPSITYTSSNNIITEAINAPKVSNALMRTNIFRCNESICA